MFVEQSTPRDAFEWDARTIRALRAFLGWSQSALARDLGIRQQTVSEWETGMYKPRGASVTILNLLARTAEFDASMTGQIETEAGQSARPNTRRPAPAHIGLLATAPSLTAAPALQPTAPPLTAAPAFQRVPNSLPDRAIHSGSTFLRQRVEDAPAPEGARDHPFPENVRLYSRGEEVPM
ncbi:MAG: helix-turn-helix transcriptional regulator [Chloroflexi bacterium]|nr:helix-turn-helix transcriptional regulator [Chloroflexota bacterium]